MRLPALGAFLRLADHHIITFGSGDRTPDENDVFLLANLKNLQVLRRAADLPQIFDRFTKSADSGGSGLGLAIARTWVEAHGGRIWVRNEPGSGAVFSFTLPVQ